MNSNKVVVPGNMRGIGLIEVLITVLVLAIGLLGLAGLQLSALQNNQSSLERSQGIVQSYTIIEAIRADVESAKSGRFNIGIDDDATGTNFPANALITWREQLTRNLGEDATGSVNCSNTVCTVTIRWDDSRGTGGSDAQELVTEVQL